MGVVGAVLGPEAEALVRLRGEVPHEQHWAFAYSTLHRVSRSFALVIQQLGPDLRNVVCVFYLVLRALDTIEDDTSIPTEIKIDDNDPNALLTRKHVNAIKETCKSSGLLKRRGYDLDRPKRNPAMIMLLLLLLVAVLLGVLYMR